MRKKKRIFGIILGLTLLVGSAIPAFAQTVYFRGHAVNWDHGRKWVVYSYSCVQTGVFEHSATANSTFSGWKRPGVEAYAQQFVGNGTARTYWNCR